MTEAQRPPLDGPDPPERPGPPARQDPQEREGSPARPVVHRLGYAAPEGNAPAAGVAPIGQLALGLAAFVAWSVVAGLLTASAVAVGLPAAVSVGAGLLSVVLLVGLTITAHRRWHWRSFLAGVLIIPGLVLLALGFCAVGLR